MTDSRPQPNVRVISIAILGGALLFATIATVLPFITGTPDAGAAEMSESAVHFDMLKLLSIVHAVLFAGCLFAVVLFGRQRPIDDQRAIMRVALLQGAACFGIVVVLLGGLRGVLPGENWLYLNLLSTLALGVFVALGFDSGDEGRPID